MKYKIITPNGDVTEGESDKPFTLEWMQGVVGGYIEMVYVDGDRILICDEEGHLKGLQPNLTACELVDSEIVGTVIVADERLVE